MFQVEPKPTFAVNVPLTVPGLPEPVSVVITFRYKNKAQLTQFLASGAGKEDHVLLHELIVSWSGFIGPDGHEVPYSFAVLQVVAQNHWNAVDEISTAYLNELKVAKTKNSRRLPAA